MVSPPAGILPVYTVLRELLYVIAPSVLAISTQKRDDLWSGCAYRGRNARYEAVVSVSKLHHFPHLGEIGRDAQARFFRGGEIPSKKPRRVSSDNAVYDA